MSFRRKNKRTKNFNAVIKNKNPQRKKRALFNHRFIFSKYFVVLLVFFVVSGALVYYFFFSGEFEITSVQITGINEELTNEVNAYYGYVSQQNKFFFLNQNNTLLFPESAFEAEITSVIPRIKNADASIAFPHLLEISAEERRQKGIWCNYVAGSSVYPCYFYDFGGYIYEEAPGVGRGSLIVAIRDTRTPETVLPQQVLDKETVEYSDNLIQALEIVYKRPTYITIQKGDEVRIGFSGLSFGQAGWEAYISRSNPIVETVENLALVLEKKIGTRTGELEYIDLRLGNKVFYKYKGTEIDEIE